MTQFNIPGGLPNRRPGFSKSDKRKLIALAVAFVVVLIVFGVSYLKSIEPSELDEDLPSLQAKVPEEVIDVPAIDPARFEALVQDGRAEDRVLLEGDAIDAALDVVRLLTPRHFEVLEERELDVAMIGEIMADPPAHRAAPFLARGWVDSVRAQKRSLTAPEEYLGRLVLEDDSVAYFLTLEMPENLMGGGFVRIDGLFLKVYSAEDEDESGSWIEGPLLVGPQVIRSYRSMGKVTQLQPRYMVGLRDEVLVLPDGTINRDVEMGLPFEPLWHAMAFVRDLSPTAVQWDEAPVLDNARLMEVMEDGSAHRMEPYRFPICRIQHATVKRAGENPARMDYYTEGWIGNISWNNVVFFKSPLQDRDVKLADFATARGFFFKNFAYESAQRGVRVAPVFILESLEVVNPAPEPIFALLAYTLAGLTLLFILLFFVLLRRDRRRSAALQEKLTLRRRARRAKGGGANPMGASTP